MIKLILPIVIFLFAEGLSNADTPAIAEGVIEVDCRNSPGNRMQTFELKLDQKRYGYSVWMNLRYTFVSYLSNEGSYENLEERARKEGRSVGKKMLKTSGGYTNRDFDTVVGFAMDRGVIINRRVAANMDALVINYDGRMEVLEIGEKIWWPPMKRSIQLNRTYDRNLFIEWAKATKVSFFQTHLLAFDNEMRIADRIREGRKATRKMLVLISDEKNNYDYIIFYIKKPESLFLATKNIFEYLRGRKKQIRYMVNLDTGVNDVLELDRSANQCNSKFIKGRTSINYAMDLLVFHEKQSFE